MKPTLRDIDPDNYEHYRYLLDRIYNAGATQQDHWQLKDSVDRYIISLAMVEREDKSTPEWAENNSSSPLL